MSTPKAKGPIDHHGNSSGIASVLCPLLNLPSELLVAIATQLAEDDELAASLACRTLRVAVAGTGRRKAGAREWLPMGCEHVLMCS
jgi:hypothetical protein